MKPKENHKDTLWSEVVLVLDGASTDALLY